MTAEERLRFYAERFPIVEVDSTYYFPPNAQLTGTWVERTPATFTMNVKAYALFTMHPAAAKSVWPDLRDEVAEEHREKKNVYLTHFDEDAAGEAWKRFRDALMPLHSAGKLGAVLFQFGPWFRPRRDTRDHLVAARQHLPDFEIAVEFRHPSWIANEPQRERTLAFLEEHRLTFVCVDEPQGFDSSVPPIDAVTTDLAMLRFHGRNRENWEKKGITAAERFRYRYPEKEVRDELATRARALSSSARETHALFNNCYRDYGVDNAADLRDLLD
jgi:uncharacterized protein YecE (DUF72 family)